ncbi:MAG: tetratricopeptide repeat protein [Rhodospirillaceae bacterium]|nr:tetratricopeptide repeat protein [Rhodospirillaceae bacterium]
MNNDPISIALELHQAGRPDEAKSQCREILRQDPFHPAAWNLLGFLQHQDGDDEGAIDAFQSAISAKPDFADAYFNLGNIFRLRGGLPDAEAAYRKYLTFNPKDAAVQMSLGIVLQEQGKYTGAAPLFREVLLQQPNNADARNNLGYVLKSLGRYEEAAKTLRSALDLDPNSAERHNNYGTVLRDLRQFEEATAAFRQALRLKPDFIEAQNNLGHALFDMGELDAALAAFNHALEIRPNDIDSYINLAGVGERANRLDIAKFAIDGGLKISPEDPSLHLIAAKCERREGETESAIERLQRIDLATARDIIAIDIAFELGQLFDKSDKAQQAFAYFSKGNELSQQFPAHREINKADFLNLTDAVDAHLSEEWLATWSNLSPPSDALAPAFIVGFPRSGTTLTEQILAAHPKLRTLDEKPTLDTMLTQLPSYPNSLAHLSDAQAAELRAIYFSAVGEFIDLEGDARIIDKMPLNIIHAVSMQRFFPAAKLILVMRHPCDSCLSCFMQNFVVNSSMANFYSLEDAVNLYVKVMQLWQKSARLLALNYHIVRYEDLIADFESETRKMLNFLELEWDPAVADYAAKARQRGKIDTPSYHQVTQDIYQSAKFRWKRYRDQFESVKPALEPFVEEFGYSWD